VCVYCGAIKAGEGFAGGKSSQSRGAEATNRKARGLNGGVEFFGGPGREEEWGEAKRDAYWMKKERRIDGGKKKPAGGATPKSRDSRIEGKANNIHCCHGEKTDPKKGGRKAQAVVGSKCRCSLAT